MRPNSSHLYKSRHGIWYFRWVVPHTLRQRHPELPKELKRSLKTADTREARALARRFYCALLLRYANGKDMSSFLDGIRISQWTVKRDPVTHRITEATTGDNETPETLALLQQLLDRDTQYAAQLPAGAPSHPTSAAQVVPSILIGEAIAQYGKLQIQTEAWSGNTFKHTHEPSLRLFKELVAGPINGANSNSVAVNGVDRPLHEVTREVLEKFLIEFWDYPVQQGKRSKGRNAREILQAGGVPQSKANVFKRLAHIRQFLAYCSDKGYVNTDLIKEIDVVLSKDTARAREKAALARAGAGGVPTDGYVAFTPEDIRALFGSTFLEHSHKNPARFWIPLLGLFTGLRVAEASQLRPSDFDFVDGIQCVRVDGESVGQSPDANSQRLKTLASRRWIPLHPKLIELGLLDYVQLRLEKNALWMWDGLLWTAKSGFGKYPSRDFQKLASKVGVHQSKRKVFHSFRSTISQELERSGLEGNLIDRFLGHEVKSTRNQSYSRTTTGRAFPVKRVFEVLKLVEFPICL